MIVSAHSDSRKIFCETILTKTKSKNNGDLLVSANHESLKTEFIILIKSNKNGTEDKIAQEHGRG